MSEKKQQHSNRSVGMPIRVVNKLDKVVAYTQGQLEESGIAAKVSRQIVLEGLLNNKLTSFGHDINDPEFKIDPREE